MADAEWHRQHRLRKADRSSRMEAALNMMQDKLEGNDKPLAVELRRIIAEALA